MKKLVMSALITSAFIQLLCGCGTIMRFQEEPFGEPMAATMMDVVVGSAALGLAIDRDNRLGLSEYLTFEELVFIGFVLDLPLSLTVDTLCLPIDLAIQK